MRNIRILCYHDVTARADASRLPGRSFPSIDEFRLQMAYLKEQCRVIDLDEVHWHCSNGDSPREFSVAVTFDDGTAGVMQAARVMADLGLPLAVFLSTRFVGSEELPWFIYLDAIIDRCRQNGRHLDVGGHRFEMGGRAEIKVFRDHAKRTLLRCGYFDQMKLLQRWGTQADMALAEVRAESRKFISWDQARQLAAQGVTFASHTHSHLDLRTLGAADIESEFGRARADIEKHLGQEHCRFVAYPDGTFDQRVLEVARRHHQAAFAAGYRYAAWEDIYRLPRRGIHCGGIQVLQRELSTRKELASWAKQRIRGLLGIQQGA
jgi:peptidoglycan/xylan/chitin deacetylase (PgdA/CDA1 family)